MYFVDTHCHLDDHVYNSDRDAVIKSAKEAGVRFIVNIGTTVETSRQALELTNEYDCVYASIGIHPHYSETVTQKDLEELENLAKNKKVVAIGETGLDYYRNISSAVKQEEIFRKLIRIAHKLSLPLILHCRDAERDLLNIIKEEDVQEVGGVLHCFSGDEELLKECLDMGLYIAVGGAITFPVKKSDTGKKRLIEVIKEIPLDRLLIETDAPYLAPQSHRGKRNEPAYVLEVAKKIAEIKNIRLEDVERKTFVNSQCIFKLGIKEEGKIAYKIRESLYLNLTNRCSNNCIFCARTGTVIIGDETSNLIVKGHNLRIKKEPTASELIDAVGNPKEYKEIVFCGYGEPLIRLRTVVEVAKALKEKGAVIRINTNGHANLIHRRNIVPELAGMVDTVTISLNSHEHSLYCKICSPQFQENVYPVKDWGISNGVYSAIKEFISECKKHIPRVEATIVTYPGVDIEECRRTAKSLNVPLRIREYGLVG